jgi:hypothetical protein
MGQGRRHFADEFNQEAIALLVSSGRPLSPRSRPEIARTEECPATIGGPSIAYAAIPNTKRTGMTIGGTRYFMGFFTLTRTGLPASPRRH